MQRTWVTEHKPRYRRWGYVEGTKWVDIALGTVFEHIPPTYPKAPFFASIGKTNERFSSLEEAQKWVEEQVSNGTAQ